MVIWEKIRKSKLSQSMLKNFLLKPISYLLNLIYTPLLLEYLGDEKYGLWATILSIISWINLCDIGIGNGLRNLLAFELSNNKLEEAKKSVSTAYIVLSIISLFITVMLGGLSFFFNWRTALNVQFDITWVMIISFAGISTNFVLGLGKMVLYVLQESEKIPVLNLVASLIQLIGLLILKQFTEGSLIYISLLFGLSSSVVFIYNDIKLAKKYVYCRLSFAYFDKNKVKLLINTGIIFLMLQLGGIAMTSTDNILISNIYGAVAVTPYSSVTRLFSAIGALYIALITPIWARVSIAYESKDYVWIWNITKKLMCIANAFGIAMLGILFLYEDIAEIWLRKRLVYDDGLILCTMACTFFEMVIATFSSILNGLNILKQQAIATMIMIPLNIPSSIFFAKQVGLGTTGIKLATLLQLLFGSIFYYILINRVVSRNIRKKGNNI